MTTTGDPRLLAQDALTTRLDDLPLDPADVVAGAPRTASTELEAVGPLSIGIWEITPGVVTDVEADELFVVLAGRGSVAFEGGRVVDLAPGTVVHLRAGDRTTWTIHETVRKVYVLPAAAHEETAQ